MVKNKHMGDTRTLFLVVHGAFKWLHKDLCLLQGFCLSSSSSPSPLHSVSSSYLVLFDFLLFFYCCFKYNSLCLYKLFINNNMRAPSYLLIHGGTHKKFYFSPKMDGNYPASGFLVTCVYFIIFFLCFYSCVRYSRSKHKRASLIGIYVRSCLLLKMKIK